MLRITACDVTAFGPFADAQFRDLDHSVVVVRGGNEAGKTSFFHFLQTMLYGIYPTDLARHPYAPREAAALEGAMTARVGDERRIRVSRRLKSTPQGRLWTRDASGEADGGEGEDLETGDSEDLRNRTVPMAQHVPQAVFESVYALTLDDLVAMEGQAWDEVQDRLLGSLSVEHVRPARAVIDELEDEATDRWRTDNRGKPEAKQLEARRRELREAAREARDRDEEIRTLRDEVAQLDERIDALQEEQVELKAAQHRADRLLPVHRLLQQIDRLEAEAGDRDEVAGLPDAPRERLADLREQLEDVEARIDEKRARLQRLQEVLDARTDAGRRLREHADAIRTWTRRIEVVETRRADLDDAVRERGEARRRLEEAARFLSGGWSDGLADPVASIPVADLRERVGACERAEQRLRETEARAETVALHATARKSTLPWGVLAGLGAVLVAVGILLPMPVSGVPVAGAALVAVGALQAWAARQHNAQLDAQEEQLDLDGRREAIADRAEQVAELLAGLPVPPERLEAPTGDLVADVTELQDALRTYRRRSEAVREQRSALQEAEAEICDLAAACGVLDAESADDPPPVAELVAEMDERLDRAQERHRKAEDAKSELPALRDEVESLAARRATLRDRRDALSRRLEALGDGDVDAGIDRLDARRTAARRADAARDRLHTEYPDWKERRAEIEALQEEEENGAWGLSDEERARVEQRLDEVADALRAAERTRTARQKDAEHLQEQPTAGEIESELVHVDRRLREVAQERDRRMLLAGIVDHADTEFRRKHQPDVIRRASDYFRSITQGRYERLALEDGDLVAYEREASFPRPVGPPMSRGTLDQVYLAIRIAIVDHLDADRQRLPLFLDEVFVNWDADRRRAAYRILADTAAHRQLFFFTCHPFFADELESTLNARTITLD